MHGRELFFILFHVLCMHPVTYAVKYADNATFELLNRLHHKLYCVVRIQTRISEISRADRFVR